METRIIIHYRDGETFTGEWESILLPETMNHKTMSSIQLQTKDGTLYTLSSRPKQNIKFWQRDTYEAKDIIARSILKELAKDTWLELSLCLKTGQPEINVIKEEVLVQ